MLHRAQLLNDKKTWNRINANTLEETDQQFTLLLTSSENKLTKFYNTPWTPALHKVFLIDAYWAIKNASHSKHYEVSHQLADIHTKVGDDVYMGNPHRNPHKQKIKANRILQAQREMELATQNRSAFLSIRQEQNILEDKRKEQRIVQQIARAERKTRCFSQMRRATQPGRSTGGLSHIIIANGDDIQRIDDPQEMNSYLYQRNINHFAQAHGTPFTVPPLSELLDFNGCTPCAQEILNGKIPDNKIHHTAKLILQECKRERPALGFEYSMQDMTNGFTKWRESTTTSPSGKHLGIYKALINAVKYNIRTETEKANNTNSPSHTNC
jgi:hypothetical protein